MKIRVRARPRANSSLLRFIERRLRFALDCFSHKISQVAVRLEDMNGPKGGRDKRCRVLVSLPAQSAVVIEDRDSDALTAISRAADRASHTVGRRLARLAY